MNPKIHRVPQDFCPVCHCARDLVQVTLVQVAGGVDPFVQARAAVITGIVQGLRGDELDLCDQCKEILEKSIATIEAMFGPGGVRTARRVIP